MKIIVKYVSNMDINDSIIVIKNLSKKFGFGGELVLDDLSLSMKVILFFIFRKERFFLC